MFFIQKKRSVTPIGHSQYLTGKVATCSGLPHLPGIGHLVTDGLLSRFKFSGCEMFCGAVVVACGRLTDDARARPAKQPGCHTHRTEPSLILFLAVTRDRSE